MANTIWNNILSGVGSALDQPSSKDIIGNITGSFMGNPWVDFSATLKNWGTGGGGIVKPAYAAENPTTTQVNNQNQNIDQTDYNEAKNAMITAAQAPYNQPIVQSSGSGSSGSGSDDLNSLISKYKASGWTDENAIMNDIRAGGGNKFTTPSTEVSESDVNWITKSLDEQLANNEKWKAAQGDIINANAGDQRIEAETGYNTSKGNLETNRATETNRAAQSLRDLAQNANDLLNRLSQQFGGGSALQASQNAAMRSINQSGGNILNTRNQAYSNIDSKISALDDVYNNEKEKINNWVKSKMGEVESAVQNWANTISGQKTEVRNAMKQQAITSARNFLDTIATQKATFDQQLDYWKQLRQADLADTAKKMQTTASYDPTKYAGLAGINVAGTNYNTSNSTLADTLGSETPAASTYNNNWISGFSTKKRDANGNIIE